MLSHHHQVAAAASGNNNSALHAPAPVLPYNQQHAQQQALQQQHHHAQSQGSSNTWTVYQPSPTAPPALPPPLHVGTGQSQQTQQQQPATPGGLSGTKSNRLCRHFARGMCTWGMSCRFSHDPTTATLDASNSSPPFHPRKETVDDDMAPMVMPPPYSAQMMMDEQMVQTTYGDGADLTTNQQDEMAATTYNSNMGGTTTYPEEEEMESLVSQTWPQGGPQPPQDGVPGTVISVRQHQPYYPSASRLLIKTPDTASTDAGGTPVPFITAGVV